MSTPESFQTTLMREAIRRKEYPSINRFVGRGADIYGSCNKPGRAHPRRKFFNGGNVLRTFLDGGSRDGNILLVQALVEAGASPNYVSDWEFAQPPLGYAVDCVKLDVFVYLLDCGADPNWQGRDGRSYKDRIATYLQNRDWCYGTRLKIDRLLQMQELLRWKRDHKLLIGNTQPAKGAVRAVRL